MKRWWLALVGGFVGLTPQACTSGALPRGAPSSTWDGGASPGEVTIHVTLPASQTFCDAPACYPVNHVTFTDSAGVAIGGYVPLCVPECTAQCQPIVCTGLCPGTGHPEGSLLTEVDATWDGSYDVASTCAASVPCFEARYAPPGHYLARFWVTPGVVNSPDAGGAVCNVTGAEQWLDVPFDLPSPSPINVAWPADAGAGD